MSDRTLPPSFDEVHEPAAAQAEKPSAEAEYPQSVEPDIDDTDDVMTIDDFDDEDDDDIDDDDDDIDDDDNTDDDDDDDYEAAVLTDPGVEADLVIDGYQDLDDDPDPREQR